MVLHFVDRSPRILWLAVTPLKAGEWISTTPAEIRFCVRSAKESSQSTLSPEDPDWQCREGEHDYRETNAFFNRLHDARVGGCPLLKFVAYDGVSLWQFIPSYLWPVFFRSIELIRLTQQVVDEVGPREIRAFPALDQTAHIWEGVVQAVGASHGIPVVFVRRGPFSASAFRRGWRKLRMRFRWMAEDLARWQLIRAQQQLRRQPQREPSPAAEGKKLLFATIARHWTSVPFEGGRYDEQFYPLLPALRSAGWNRFVGIDCPYDSAQRVIEVLQDRMRDRSPGVSWHGFWGFGRASHLRAVEARARRILRDRWRTLRRAEDFAEAFCYQGVSLWPALDEELDTAFRHILPRCASMLAVAEEILKRERPDAVIATYEMGPFQRALVLQASRAGLPTMGLMHGMIFDDHYDYMHRRVTTSAAADPFGFIVPEVTCVWGPAWKENLVSSGHYPAEAVAVTGNWRYDHLVESLARLDVAGLRRSLGLVGRVILILSSNRKVLEYIEGCVSMVARVPDSTPLVKLHPADDPEPVRRLLHRLGFQERILFSGPLVDALVVADVVISQPSTAISEAVMLGKPVILADFRRAKGSGTRYAAEGICLVAHDEEGLRQALERLLSDEGVRKSLAAARRAFIERYFFKIDGNASHRVAEVLETLVRGRGLSRLGEAVGSSGEGEPVDGGKQ